MIISNIDQRTKFLAAALFALLWVGPAFASEADQKQAQANFQKADVNTDQKLDFAEFTAFINLNADQNLGRASTVRRLGLYKKGFDQVDTNKDGVVTKEEVIAHSKN